MRRSIHSRVLRMGSPVVAVLLVAGATVGLDGGATAVAAAGGSSVPSAAGSVLHKSAHDLTHSGTGPANHGDTVKWVVDYTDNGTGAAPASITDPIAGAQSYVPGSLSVPPGWTPSWSKDGTTFEGTDAGTATTAVRASDPSARPGGTSVDSALLPPVQAVATATGGDGFTPILYRAGDRTEAWNIFHHSNAPAAALVCTDLTTGKACAGGPWPKPLNAAPGAFGSGATADLSSTLTEQYVFDPDRAGVVYYPALSSASVGVGCLDLAARENCGFFPLVARGGSPSSVNGLGGIVTQGGDLYAVASTGQVLCLVMATRTPCAGQPYAPIVSPNNDQPGIGHSDYLGAMTVGDGKIYASSSPNTSSTGAHAPVLGCFDPATHAACAGFSSPWPLGATGNYTYNAYLGYDTAGHADGVCATVVTGGSPSTTCYGFSGSPHAAPALGTLPSGVLTFTPETYAGTDGHTRSYMGMWGGAVAGATVCYDWTTAAPCPGFPAYHPGVNGGQTRDYGYANDTTSGCMYGLGDAGVLFSLDPTTGASPCLRSGATVRVSPAAFYCDGGTGHVRGYRDARLSDIDMATVNLGASSATVTDGDGATIVTSVIAADGSIDLSGISVASHPTISVNTRLVLKNADHFSGELVVTYDGDPPQVCFNTKIGDGCTVTDVSNTATGSDVTGDLTSNTVKLPVTPGAQCQPDVTVNKEICASALSSHCGPNGAGPWVKQTPGGLLGLLGTAYWRITVANAGPVDATHVTLDDAVEPSCERAAGTFDLAANQSKQFYCSTFLLLLPLKNTVSASYVPINSPPGTCPTTTKSSSAIACGLLCLLKE